MGKRDLFLLRKDPSFCVFFPKLENIFLYYNMINLLYAINFNYPEFSIYVGNVLLYFWFILPKLSVIWSWLLATPSGDLLLFILYCQIFKYLKIKQYMFYILGVLWEREIIEKTFESLSTKCHKLQLKKVMNPIQTVSGGYTVDDREQQSCLENWRPMDGQTHWVNDMASFISIKVGMIQVHALANYKLL